MGNVDWLMALGGAGLLLASGRPGFGWLVALAAGLALLGAGGRPIFGGL
jgi:hypothetical protein